MDSQELLRAIPRIKIVGVGSLSRGLSGWWIMKGNTIAKERYLELAALLIDREVAKFRAASRPLW